ncbi:MAG TPA: ATP-binding protein [Flavobacteriales bacterium]|nr:ATP-binding protein [Flavobacteriales bacterium]
MKIHRAIEESFRKALKPNKVLLLLGARRTGKTWFLKNILPELGLPYLFLNGDDSLVQSTFQNRTVENYTRLVGNNKLLVIDEAHRIPEIGWCLKLMVDEIEGLHIIATGSSVFDLRNSTGEPLTGRKKDVYLFPFAQMEYSKYENVLETQARLPERLVYGNYPELVHLNSLEEKADYLRDMVSSYLLKDILEFEGIRNASKVSDLLRLIAFQPGKEVSLDELSRNLGISKNTVDRYLDLLQKVFVIQKLQGFSRNLRKEVTRHARYYFTDNGIRNALINNFNALPLRNDVGELWENYLMMERLKFQSYTNLHSLNYFWRTYQQQEIDWVEDRNGKLYAYECKWKDSGKVKIPSAWKDAYPESEFSVISPSNYLNWIQ